MLSPSNPCREGLASCIYLLYKNVTVVNRASAQALSEPTRSIANVDFNATRARYAFGCQGKPLMRTTSACGAISFLLFGYDQGVLVMSS
ncbi:hypothetical protein jhhlp_008237 [Lomentospora prolificans]|uniref:Uncharacterized protein n=1 Tax=Lomentospora prolificans TaxID=41688 RepID=A0A2N3MXG5_9PEZI|nr:hypothetical protein jhhlp_008237 [Lomentospora prolificans]